jgi:hypothetical protein
LPWGSKDVLGFHLVSASGGAGWEVMMSQTIKCGCCDSMQFFGCDTNARLCV